MGELLMCQPRGIGATYAIQGERNMGLDWNPGPKAKAGYEAEFEKLWRELHSKSCLRDAKVRGFGEITAHPFDTLGAPTVHVDAAATEWVRQQFDNRVDKSLTEEQFLSGMTGFRVLPLVPHCDGLPRYTNGCPGWLCGGIFLRRLEQNHRAGGDEVL